MKFQIPIFALLEPKINRLSWNERAESCFRHRYRIDSRTPVSVGGSLVGSNCVRLRLGPCSAMCRSMESQTLGEARQVGLFRIGRSQAVRIPRGFELPGGEATIRKVGDRLILEPVPRKSLLQVLATMTPLAPCDDFPDVDKTLEPLDEAPFGLGR